MTVSRRLGYETECLTCEDVIHPDERAFVERGVGAWHEDCDPPRNLRLYLRERDARPRRKARPLPYRLDDDE